MGLVPIEIRNLREAEIPAGLRLAGLAGWNQTARDWRRFLDLEPDGCFAGVRQDRVCGTATALSYDRRFGWVGMVLVDPAERRQGIGTRLLQRAVEYLQCRGVETVKLDATPMGKPLYSSLGFQDEFELERWDGRAPGGPRMPSVSEDDFGRVCDWDREVFGADRSRLLRALWREGPEYSAIDTSGGELCGYVFGRAGTRAHYIGPWVAAGGGGCAGRLLRGVMGRFAGDPVFIDLCRACPEARAIVRQEGFCFQRTLTRMFLGPNRYPGRPELTYGIAGPELG